MREAANENEPLTLRPIAVAAADLVRRLERSKQKREQSERDAQRDTQDEEKEKERARYVEQRLRDIAAFEARYRPKERQSGG